MASTSGAAARSSSPLPFRTSSRSTLVLLIPSLSARTPYAPMRFSARLSEAMVALTPSTAATAAAPSSPSQLSPRLSARMCVLGLSAAARARAPLTPTPWWRRLMCAQSSLAMNIATGTMPSASHAARYSFFPVPSGSVLRSRWSSSAISASESASLQSPMGSEEGGETGERRTG
eukprot:scaffold41244_cov30-Tisochrysis_lutea.AAC.1